MYLENEKITTKLPKAEAEEEAEEIEDTGTHPLVRTEARAEEETALEVQEAQGIEMIDPKANHRNLKERENPLKSQNPNHQLPLLNHQQGVKYRP